jgi:hypothetical protein
MAVMGGSQWAHNEGMAMKTKFLVMVGLLGVLTLVGCGGDTCATNKDQAACTKMSTTCDWSEEAKACYKKGTEPPFVCAENISSINAIGTCAAVTQAQCSNKISSTEVCIWKGAQLGAPCERNVAAANKACAEFKTLKTCTGQPLCKIVSQAMCSTQVNDTPNNPRGTNCQNAGCKYTAGPGNTTGTCTLP